MLLGPAWDLHVRPRIRPLRPHTLGQSEVPLPPDCSVVVAPTAIGLSYGFIGACRNLGVSLVTITAGVIKDHSSDYMSVRER